MAKKIAELSIAQFAQEIEAYDPDVVKQCRNNDVDIEGILTKQKALCDPLGLRAGISIGRAALQREILNLTAEYKTGVLVGSTDRYDSKAPIRITMLLPDGTGMTLSTFDSRAKIGLQKVDMIYPSLAKVMVDYDEKWQNWNVREFMSMDPVDKTELLEALGEVALLPGEVGIQHEKSIVVVKGVISDVVTTPILVYEEEEGRYSRAGEFEVIEEPTGPDSAPPMVCLGLRLEPERDVYDAINYVTVQVGKQRYGQPYVDVPDLYTICKDAVKFLPDDPGEQRRLVADAVRGLVVYAIGYMGAVGQDRNENSEPVNYIRVNAACIIGSGEYIGKHGEMVKLSDFGTGAASTETVETVETADVPANPTPQLEKPTSTAEKIASKDPKAISMTKIKNQIVGFCRISGVSVSELNLDELHPLIMDGNVPKAMLEVILADMVEESVVSGD